MRDYRPSARTFTCKNGEGVCNRPLFCANGPTSVLAGDKPILRLIRYRTLLGTFRAWIGQGNERRYLDCFEQTDFTYTPNLCHWVLRDNTAHCVIRLSVGVPENTEGFVLTVSSDWPLSLNWEFGGITRFEGSFNLSYENDPEVRSPEMDPTWTRGNLTSEAGEDCVCIADRENEIFVSAPGSVLAFQNLPLVRGITPIFRTPVYIGVGRTPPGDLQTAYGSALARGKRLENLFQSETPDPWLDAQMAAIPYELDGGWYPPRTMHSNQIWNSPFLGWCNRFGNAICGWKDRIEQELEYYVSHLHRTDDRHGGAPDPKTRMCEAGPESRLYGFGHVDADQFFYDMQSEFFDQAIFAWRYTGSQRIAELLRDALELHTHWMDECFDPDRDGLYESYINTWPTDSVWYSGGGSCEETCYAYRAHDAAYELCVSAGDTAAAALHRVVLERIAKAFIDKLWIQRKGYPAMFREYEPPHRLHDSAWLYNAFLPVDCELVDPFEAASCLDYSRWGLENVPEPLGGRSVFLSNWVPSIWSVRKNSPGENFYLAYAYFKAGFAEEGCELLNGTLRKVGFGAESPGYTPGMTGSLLSLAVVCGLHGFRPDYPNGKVLLAPCYPHDWRQCSLSVPGLRCSYKRVGEVIAYHYQLDRSAQVTLRLPFFADGVVSVSGAESWKTEPGFGGQVLVCEAGDFQQGEITVVLEHEMRPQKPVEYACAPGETVFFDRFPVQKIYDPQKIFIASNAEQGMAAMTLAKDTEGSHMAFVLCGREGLSWWQILRFQVSPSQSTLEQRERTLVSLGRAEYAPVSMFSSFNSDVTTIFQQQYLSPRPEGVNLSIGADGYSPWTFAHWENGLPEIRFDYPSQTVQNPSGVPFLLGDSYSNIAFTSRWDNWPTQVAVPVGVPADAVWCLVCGSTNPMQCGIANGVLRFRYDDGSCDELELIPPENYWTLASYTCAPSSPEQHTCNDYSYGMDGFCLPTPPPETLQLGENCRAMVLGYRLRPGKALNAVELETLSSEVVIGLMAVTLVHYS